MCITATLLRPSSLWMVLRGGYIEGFGRLVGCEAGRNDTADWIGLYPVRLLSSTAFYGYIHGTISLTVSCGMGIQKLHKTESKATEAWVDNESRRGSHFKVHTYAS